MAFTELYSLIKIIDIYIYIYIYQEQKCPKKEPYGTLHFTEALLHDH